MLQYSQTLDRVFHALGDPHRRSIVERLTRGPATTSELAQPLDITLSAVAQHLKVLEASGLLRSEKRGRQRLCHIERGALTTAESWISKRRAMIEERLDALAVHLGEEPHTTRKLRSSK